jgi:glycogen phosphorylase/synthase
VRELTTWKRRIHARFSTVHIEKVTIKGIKGDVLPSDSPLEVEMIINPGRLEPSEIAAELAIGFQQNDGKAHDLRIIPHSSVERVESLKLLRYKFAVDVGDSGSYVYAVRVLPVHPLLVHNQETGLVRWA